jgi:hypothetical protein
MERLRKMTKSSIRVVCVPAEINCIIICTYKEKDKVTIFQAFEEILALRCGCDALQFGKWVSTPWDDFAASVVYSDDGGSRSLRNFARNYQIHSVISKKTIILILTVVTASNLRSGSLPRLILVI